MQPLLTLRERGNNTAEGVGQRLADGIEFGKTIPIGLRRKASGRIWSLSSQMRPRRSVRENRLDDRSTFLQGETDRREITGLELFENDAKGLMTSCVAASRPLPAVKLFRASMYAHVRPEFSTYLHVYDPAPTACGDL